MNFAVALSAALGGLSFASSLFGPDKNEAAIQQAKAEYGRRLHELYSKTAIASNKVASLKIRGGTNVLGLSRDIGDGMEWEAMNIASSFRGMEALRHKEAKNEIAPEEGTALSRGRRTTIGLLHERSKLEQKIFTAKGIGAFKKQLGAQRKFDQQEMQRIAERPTTPTFGPAVMIPGKQSGFSKFVGALTTGLSTYGSSASAITDIKKTGFLQNAKWFS